MISSVLLLGAADGLRRGRRLAWAYVTVLIALLFVLLLFANDTAERDADLLLVGGQLALLLLTHRAFTARSERRSFRRAGRRLLLVVAGLFLYTAAGFGVLRDDFVPTLVLRT